MQRIAFAWWPQHELEVPHDREAAIAREGAVTPLVERLHGDMMKAGSNLAIRLPN